MITRPPKNPLREDLKNEWVGSALPLRKNLNSQIEEGKGPAEVVVRVEDAATTLTDQGKNGLAEFLDSNLDPDSLITFSGDEGILSPLEIGGKPA